MIAMRSGWKGENTDEMDAHTAFLQGFIYRNNEKAAIVTDRE
jgi:hypothetical protein